MKIGVFDSGLGGFIMLDAIQKVLPEYDYIFYGDTKNLPYGDKSEEEVLKLSQDAFEHLFERDVVLIISACNSVSASTLRKLQDGFIDTKYPDRRALGVIIPTVEEVLDSNVKDVLLLATPLTVNSKKYDRELESSDVKLVSVAMPTLATLIEDQRYEEAVLLASESILEARTEGVILGCTHYSKIKDQLRERFPEKKIFSQDEIIPNKLINYLNNHPEISERLSKGGGVECYCTGKFYL